MLHEAADASFEKNIESLAAADNDACSYADLPKAKIQELSEKILYLPHQGMDTQLSVRGQRVLGAETTPILIGNSALEATGMFITIPIIFRLKEPTSR